MGNSLASDIIDGRDDFVVYTNGSVDIVAKSITASIEDRRPIGGWCSTEHLDRQDEQVLAKGLDFTEFVNHGFYNENHQQRTGAAVGEPDLAELRKGRWYTEGRLYKGHAPADEIWELAKAMQKSNAKRRLGFSIEGKVTERDYNNRIVKAIIREVAITKAPVNTNCTWDIISKAFTSVSTMNTAAAGRQLVTTGLVQRQQLGGISAVRAGELVRERWPHFTMNEAVRIGARIITLESKRRQ